MNNQFDGDDLCHGITATALIAAACIAMLVTITIAICMLAIL